MLWTETKISGRKAATAEYSGKRLYISENARGFEAWVDSIRLGVFATDEQARKATVASAAGAKVVAPKPECRPIQRDSNSRKFVMTVGDAVLPAEPVIMTTEQRLAHPDIEMPTADDLTEAALVTALEGAGEITVKPTHIEISLPPVGYCTCGTKLGRSGRCPALCTPVTDAAPYTGPYKVGKTHTARLGAPVSW